MTDDLPEDIAISQTSMFADYGPDHLEHTTDPIFLVSAVAFQWAAPDELPEPVFLFRFNPGRADAVDWFVGLPFGFMDDFVTQLTSAWELYKTQAATIAQEPD